MKSAATTSAVSGEESQIEAALAPTILGASLLKLDIPFLLLLAITKEAEDTR